MITLLSQKRFRSVPCSQLTSLGYRLFRGLSISLHLHNNQGGDGISSPSIVRKPGHREEVG